MFTNELNFSLVSIGCGTNFKGGCFDFPRKL